MALPSLPAAGANWSAWGAAVHDGVSAARSELIRLVPTPPLHPAPPTVTLGAANGATPIASPVAIPASHLALRYSSCVGTTNPAVWYRIGVTPNGSGNDQGAPYMMDFMIDSADFAIRLFGQNINRMYKLWVDGQPLTSGYQTGPGSTGLGHYLRLQFTSRAPRHIRIMTTAGIVEDSALSIGAGDTVWASTLPLYSQRAYFLGDSFSNGSNDGFLVPYMWRIGAQFGWEIMQGGEAGTGYTTAGDGVAGRATFPARVPTDIVPTNPDLVVVYGGTNDAAASTGAIQTAAAATFTALRSGLPNVPVYVFGVQYPTGAADPLRDSHDAAIAAAAAAAPNVVLFTSTKSWMTGTGNAGTPAGNGNADVMTSSDGLHPTSAGHNYIAARMAHAIMPTYTA